MSQSQKIAVIGGGSFGTAIAKVLSENGQSVLFWMRDPDRAEEIQRTRVNRRYMPDVVLDPLVEATTDLKACLRQCPVVFLALPSKAFRPFMAEAAEDFHPNQIVVSLTKGIEREGFRLMSEILQQIVPKTRIGVLGGPNLAAEIIRRDLTASVIASADADVRKTVQALLGCEYFRVYANVDVYGVELGGALKNIYAIVAGLAAALGMGENTKAMLITRSLAEMSRFAVSLGANPMTFLGLAGVGDLIVTCHSPLSRNYRVGYALGKGDTLEHAVAELGQVAEGINTLLLVKEKAEEMDIYMPLVKGLYEIIYNKANIRDVIQNLMMAVQSSDVEFILPRPEGC
ncbi:NAD(P)H-dependent glycerol-3-phosphate dehydrogenase [Mangrovitalea sediminis]|uniref:NAD(P)H-dependent glycerol-3-phosphate dehydrogenase n=1 Tax=Mangrovitalea sediminis TaxID=1982043 RepID=UPI000BE588B9|nr:NAD(P)H-dependent glycerol-3-phosphate dehydrogenase [Mangrovitalea sediminis]